MHFLSQYLFHELTIEAEIIRIHEKYKKENKDLRYNQEGVELATLAQNAKEYSKIFARELKHGRYKIEPARLVEIETNGKKRTLYLFSVNDSIVHGIVSQAIHNYCQEKGIYSPNLKSYLKGKSHWKTLKEFAQFVRQYHQSSVPKKERGLFILRRDIASYTDRIPVDNESLLWPLLKKELGFPNHPTPLEERAWNYTREVIQTEAKTKEGNTFKKMVGVPTGSPISTTLFNFYSLELDRKIDALQPQYYTRYGDDIIIADQNRAVTNTASKIIQDTLSKYRLESNAKKKESFYLNNAGRHPTPPSPPSPNPSEEDEYPGRDRILFLGCEIKADGTVSLSKKSKNQMLLDLRERLSRINHNLPKPLQLELLCQTAAHALDPTQPLCHKTATLLRYNVTDRTCLHDLDKRIGLELLRKLTGRPHPKGYRIFPLKTMRAKGLPSLVALLNKQK